MKIESLSGADTSAFIFFEDEYQQIAQRTDQMFVRLMAVQWVVSIALSLWLSPLSWEGSTSSLHVHVMTSAILGGLLFLAPYLITKRAPGSPLARHVVAVSQMLWSGLLIHVSGGRIETHFHIFGSLALLSFYRDWRVFIPATIVTAADHLLRGWLAPESLFGISEFVWWRAFEHAGWVLFIDVFLVTNCRQSKAALRKICDREMELVETQQAARVAVADKVRAAERLKADEELASGRKMEAIGQVAAGVAHEINTPTQYVSDNTVFLERAFAKFQDVIVVAENLASADDEERPELIKALKKQLRKGKIAFLKDEVPRALSESMEGLQRVASIVAAMKEFSHPSDGSVGPTDVKRSIETTLAVCRNEWKYVAKMRTEFPENLRPIDLFRDEFNQVILNMVVNAAHALRESQSQDGSLPAVSAGDPSLDGAAADSIQGEIRIVVEQGDAETTIRIEDNGTGMPPHVVDRIFDPFYTTKEVGEGTGQGLALAQRVILKLHKGDIHVESEEGVGTVFTLRLPNVYDKPEEVAA